MNLTITAVLSSTVLPVDGFYSVRTLTGAEREELLSSGLKGVPHYISHPDTKAIVEACGAVQAPTKLFTGLKPGESVVCAPIKQGLSTRATEGFTVHQAIKEIETLDLRVVTRVDLGGLDQVMDRWMVEYACSGDGGSAEAIITAAIAVLEASGVREPIKVS